MTATAERAALAAERRRQIVELTVMEVSQTQIAQQLGMSQPAVSRALRKALADATKPAGEYLKEMQVARTQWLCRQAVKGILAAAPGSSAHSAALASYQRALEYLGRLEGVDAAIQIRVKIEDAIDAEIRRLQEELAAGDGGTPGGEAVPVEGSHAARAAAADGGPPGG